MHFPFISPLQTLGGLEPPTSLSTGLDEDILTVAAGKDFTLVRTVGGKVLLQLSVFLYCTVKFFLEECVYLYIICEASELTYPVPP